ncbi:FtsX-like permease family protein [Actinomadura madurae]|uniref:FtsX-like permease family protein n=1 Tax=Actinomadura madurae TaxID=1993 RepID=UPI002026A9CB|nr:FtsX-like permease family protein [Actinomadura madurae]URN01963.1 FtsX-like permease family protein [Actinomadura madurae]
MNRYAFALRMARQDALRAKGRTALVLCMIGLPVCVVVALAVIRKTASEPGVEATSAPAESAILAMIVAMAVLQVVLLAGPALVVDVRRRRRELALVAATGGAGRHLRAVVLASGLLLGGIAAVAGTALGVAAAAVTIRVAEANGAEPFGPFRVPWSAVAVTALLGVVTGLLAALIPARQAARMDVVAALAGRREPPGRARRGWPAVGGLLVVAGVAGSLAGVRALHEFGAAFGAAAIIIGLVVACPWLVGATGRLAHRLPLPLRLAVRDGARNRARTAPAIAAITAAVAGITALAIGGASDFRQEQVDYRAELPMGSTVIRPSADKADAVAPALRGALPGVPLVTLRALPGEGSTCTDPDTSRCKSVAFTPDEDEMSGFNIVDNVVGGAREARMLLGRDDPAVAAALAEGKIVLFGTRPPAGGKVTATISYWADDQEHTAGTVKDLPAVAAEGDPHVAAIVPPDVAERVAERADTTVRTEAYGIDRADHRVTPAEQAKLERTLAAFTPYDDMIYVERGFTDSYDKPTLLLGAAAGRPGPRRLADRDEPGGRGRASRRRDARGGRRPAAHPPAADDGPGRVHHGARLLARPRGRARARPRGDAAAHRERGGRRRPGPRGDRRRPLAAPAGDRPRDPARRGLLRGGRDPLPAPHGAPRPVLRPAPPDETRGGSW